MRKLADHFASVRFSRVILCSLILCGVSLLVFWDKAMLDRDFKKTKTLLADTRYHVVRDNRVLIAKFRDRKIIVSDAAGNVIQELDVPRLYEVNYDTTRGEDMIVFTGHGTSPYNIRVHGGDLTLRSWLGFKRSIHVNCTGFVREGLYPSD